ncbi:MAG: hypothetical protein QM489_00840 [Candidatus Izemoplasma sp.]
MTERYITVEDVPAVRDTKSGAILFKKNSQRHQIAKNRKALVIKNKKQEEEVSRLISQNKSLEERLLKLEQLIREK